MTKRIMGVIVLAIALGFGGCASKEGGAAKMEGASYPKWIDAPKHENMVVGLGSAQSNAGGDFNFQRQEAVANARTDIARQIESKVGTMFKNYTGTTGAKKGATYDKATSDTGKQIASQTIKGSKVVGTWRDKNGDVGSKGTLFVLVAIDTEHVSREMDKAIKTSYKNEQAMYQRFLADKANGELKKELEEYEKSKQ